MLVIPVVLLGCGFEVLEPRDLDDHIRAVRDRPGRALDRSAARRTPAADRVEHPVE